MIEEDSACPFWLSDGLRVRGCRIRGLWPFGLQWQQAETTRVSCEMLLFRGLRRHMSTVFVPQFS